MTLAQVSLATPVRVLGFDALSETEKMRLSSLGLREGAPITKLLRTPLRDPIECLVGPQLVTIDSWLLDRILVEQDLSR